MKSSVSPFLKHKYIFNMLQKKEETQKIQTLLCFELSSTPIIYDVPSVFINDDLPFLVEEKRKKLSFSRT